MIQAHAIGRPIETETDPVLLAGLGDYFYKKGSWKQAAQAYEKAEKTKHDPYTLLNWYKSTIEAGLAFDFQRFLKSEDVDVLNDYGYYFIEKEKWNEATQLFEKAERQEHSTQTLENLYTCRGNGRSI